MADSIQFHGQEKITKWLNRVLKEAGDHSKLMHNIGSILEHNTKQRINTGIGTDDKPWQKSWRAKMQGGTTLRDTSRLYNSIKYTVLDGGKRVIVGTNVFYAPVMHFGATIRAKSGKYLKFKTTMGGWAQVQSVIIPARPFLGMSVDDSQEVLFEIEEHLLELLMNAK
ncbi:phage virion morphogenesis protein [Acinetobacter tibetensis]|uniref:Phage virion morphogenesis protein n=1 Tax=Acinetobacter tibetensis TaxID=2943497 RepID=A0AAE9LP95_9GAMM|nr:phage virion morphogenesis protein [Acinetobacter tibetensis]USE82030.1 phage virion morphogenesis protein [Acinetobacter tibetensis]